MAGDRTSKSQEKRKSSKPQMEKRRRARINECLTDLQGILETANNGQEETTGGHSKREKAEILEQTVQLVKRLRRQDQIGISTEPIPQAQYRAGFNECLNEVSRFMEANNSALNVETRSGLLNHLAGSLGSCSSNNSSNGWSASAPPGHRQFGPGLGSIVPREVVVHHGRPSSDRPAMAPGAATIVQQSPQALATPPKVMVPPLPPAQPPPTAPSMSSQLQAGANANNAIPVQQSPRKGEHPIAACVPPLASANPGVTLPVNIPQAPAGHVALVLPAHLLGSFVGGQFATGQVIPLYHQQSGSPGVVQQRALTTSVALPAGSVGVSSSSPAPVRGSKLDNQCATSSSSVGAGPIFIVPSPNLGNPTNMAPNSARPVAPTTPSPSSVHAYRGGIPVLPSNPSTAPSSVVAMETRNQNGVVYAPASLPMQLYVNGPFANGLSLPNPSTLAMGPHWRPWGWDQDQR
ncbi:transcription factor HES-4-like [Patiria miniata]|uniref:Uncharacterized protein n=1 Tax=Patiria miniata TaxID=46514 RepID=A0A913Z6N1_PATMI|nr:transcription factor HES-4-like [Patiria miniata]